MSPRRILIVLAAAAIPAACAPVGPNYQRPAVTTPGAYASLAGGAPATEGDPSLAEWWRVFNDPMLDDLVARALERNHDLRIAAARVREARALRGAADSALLPRADARAGVTRSQRSGTLRNAFGSDDPTTLWSAGLDAVWEIDVFGGTRRSIEALERDLEASEEARRDVGVTLAAEVARTYVELRALQQRIEVGERAVRAQQETLDLTGSRAVAGIAPEIETEQARAQLAARQGRLPPLRAAARRAAFRLSVLLAEHPGTLLDSLASARDIPRPPEAIPVGLPSDLLRRRPDIRRAERLLAGSTARIGVETAALYPSFSLTGSAGFQSAELASLLDSSSRFWSIGPSIQWRLFDRREIRRRIEAADARAEQSLLAYEQSVLRALEDVETSLTDLRYEQERRADLARAVDAGQRAVDLATERYRGGVGDFLTVLINQRELYDAQDQLVQSEADVTRAVVLLYKALGGGWEPPADPSPANPETAPAAEPAT